MIGMCPNSSKKVMNVGSSQDRSLLIGADCEKYDYDLVERFPHG